MNQNNRFDYLIILIIALLAFGNVGGAIQPVRFVALASLPYTILQLSRNSIYKQVSNVIWLFAFWYGYSVVSMLWTSDTTEGIKELVYYPSHFALFLLIFVLSQKAANPARSIMIGWIAFFLATVPIALNEIFNNVHLSSAKHDADKMSNMGGVLFHRKFASVTFGNMNGYTTVLCLALPFVLSIYQFCKKIKYKLLFWATILCMSYIMLINSSRGGILTLAASVAVFLFYAYKRGSLSLPVLFTLILAAIGIFVYYFDDVFFQIAVRVGDGSGFFEDSGRSSIYGVAFEVFLSTWGVGAGIGSIQASMAQFTTGITIAHNLWLEILIQYGVIITIAVLFFGLRIFKRLISHRNNTYSMLGVIAIVGILPMSVINSGYLLMPALWAYLVSLYTISKLK